MLKIGQNWGKIANHIPDAQQKSAPLIVAQTKAAAKQTTVSISCIK